MSEEFFELHPGMFTQYRPEALEWPPYAAAESPLLPHQEALFGFVGARMDSSADHFMFVVEAADTAVRLVNGYMGLVDGLVDTQLIEREIPADVYRRAVLEVGAELFHRRSTKNGVMQFATADAQPIHVRRDPMVPAYALLGRFVGPGVA